MTLEIFWGFQLSVDGILLIYLMICYCFDLNFWFVFVRLIGVRFNCIERPVFWLLFWLFEGCVQGLCSCLLAFSGCGKWGISRCGAQASHYCGFSRCRAWAQGTGSVVVGHRLSCPTADGVFPDQGSNPCPLRRQADV